MKRILLLLVVALVMAAMVASTALPAPAKPPPPTPQALDGQMKACINSNNFKAFGGCA